MSFVFLGPLDSWVNVTVGESSETTQFQPLQVMGPGAEGPLAGGLTADMRLSRPWIPGPDPGHSAFFNSILCDRYKGVTAVTGH